MVLEIRRTDIAEDLAFAPPTEDKPFHQVTLTRPNILFSSVVAVHPFETVELNGVPGFKFPAGA